MLYALYRILFRKALGLVGAQGDLLAKDNWFDDESVSSNSWGLSWSSYSYPSDGLVYIWTPPVECETPTAQPGELTLTATSNSIDGTFATQGEGDHYIVLLTSGEEPNLMPVDGVHIMTAIR